jgi:hypothetical protein
MASCSLRRFRLYPRKQYHNLQLTTSTIFWDTMPFLSTHSIWWICVWGISPSRYLIGCLRFEKFFPGLEQYFRALFGTAIISSQIRISSETRFKSSIVTVPSWPVPPRHLQLPSIFMASCSLRRFRLYPRKQYHNLQLTTSTIFWDTKPSLLHIPFGGVASGAPVPVGTSQAVLGLRSSSLGLSSIFVLYSELPLSQVKFGFLLRQDSSPACYCPKLARSAVIIVNCLQCLWQAVAWEGLGIEEFLLETWAICSHCTWILLYLHPEAFGTFSDYHEFIQVRAYLSCQVCIQSWWSTPCWVGFPVSLSINLIQAGYAFNSGWQTVYFL